MKNALLKKVIDERYRGKNSALARRLWKEIKKRFPAKSAEDDQTQERNLATKIGELVNCKDESRIGWWRNVEDGKYLELLSELTGLSAEALLSPTENQISFPEFPELATWRPQDGDALCPIWYETSQNFQPRPPSSLLDIVVKHLSEETSGLLWIVVLPGCGKATTLRAMEILHSDKVYIAEAEHGYLSDISLPDADKLAFLVVHRLEQDLSKFQGQIEALLRRKTSAVVLAPFDIPRKISGASTRPKLGEKKLGEKHPVLASDWRSRVVVWAAQRYVKLYKQNKWPGELTELMIQLCNSPLKDFIQSPGDVLALCRQCRDGQLNDIDDIDLSDLSSKWLEQVGFASSQEKSAQKKKYNQAVYSVFMNRDVEWLKAGQTDWETAFSDNKVFHEMLVKLGGGKKDIASPALFKFGVAGIIPYPNWVAAGTLMPPAEEGQKEYFFEPNNIRQWAWTGADNSRKNLLLSLLRNCRSSVLKLNITESLKGVEGFERLGGIEAIVRFAADDPQSINKKFCNSIPWEEFFRNLDAFGHPRRDIPGEKFHFPLTWEQRNPAVGELSDSMTFNASEMIREFMQAGWGLSHEYSDCENAKAALPEAYSWIFPFWMKEQTLGLENIPFESSYWPTSDEFFQWARELIDKDKVTLPREMNAENIPAIFLPAFLLSQKYLKSLFGGKNVPFAQYIMSKIQNESSAAEWLGKQLNGDEIDKVIYQQCCDLIWRSIRKDSVLAKIECLVRDYPALADVVCRNVSEGELRQTVGRPGGLRRGSSDNSNLLNNLSESQKIAVLTEWLERADANADETAFDAYAFAPLLTKKLWRAIKETSGQADNISELLRRMPRIVIGPIARQIWLEDADWAMEEIKKWISEPTFRDEGLQEWFCVAPREQFGALAEVLKSTAPRPIWTKKWCRIAIGRAGSATEKLFELM